MKKLFTMTLLALIGFATSADAQNYRKWDFTNWSAQTVANLAADAAASSTVGWSDIEKKADAGEGKVAPEATAGKCYWLQEEQSGELTANGVVIAELEGLFFGTSYANNRSLAIAVDYPSTSLGEYAGPQYLWLGGGNKSAGSRLLCFTIPNVRIGQKMTFTVESHKPSDKRGISLFVGDVNNEANKIGESFTPTTQDTYTWEDWTLPEGTTDNGDGTVDVLVYNTNGCHIYSIEIGDNTEKSKAAFLFGGAQENDFALSELSNSEKYDVVPVEANGAFTLADLQDYDAIIISSTVENAEAIASLKAIRPFVPTLNLNPALYAAWGFGTAVTAEAQFANVKQPNHALFRDLELIETDEEGVGLFITGANSYQAVTLAADYADDAILATVMGNDELVAIHGHSLSRNAYIYLPFTQEALFNNGNSGLLMNAVSVVANTKAAVSPAPAPTISQEYQDRMTIVTLKSTVPMAEIFYTLDGSNPTENSTLYTEPFTVSSEGVTVKAVARGEGFLMSDPAEQAIVIKSQAAAPTISVDGNVVTITSEVEGDEIYYNFTGSSETGKSSLYAEPFTLKKSRTVYAFAVADGFINSEVVSQEVTVEGSKNRTNILSHMDSNSGEYNNGSTSTSYYFTWGKNKSGENGHPYYKLESRIDEVGEPDPETGDETFIATYTELNDEEEKDFETGWILRSRGQIVDWENLSTGTNYGDHGGYNYATVEDDDPDFPATKGVIVLADKNTEPSDATFPYNAYIVSKEKFAAPFDIVANIGSIVKPENNANHNVVLQVATDGNAWDSSWQTLGDTINISDRQRLTTNVVRSYNSGEEVYVRAYLCGGNSKVGFYDIYIANDPNEEAGLEGDVNADGTVDVADISAVISVMAGTASYDGADVNGDGTVDVADISSVITIMARN
ncbi:MAG: chitobiase/beta-hexosaminidase C-terminal domain-containing protein [Prevotella sp.]|nr:chitobiase/beta-hexosaminidase C-terminal domain-containing protein [Prevotella sp.]